MDNISSFDCDEASVSSPPLLNKDECFWTCLRNEKAICRIHALQNVNMPLNYILVDNARAIVIVF